MRESRLGPSRDQGKDSFVLLVISYQVNSVCKSTRRYAIVLEIYFRNLRQHLWSCKISVRALQGLLQYFL